MATQEHFGDAVIAEAVRLRQTGLDANQIAGMLCKRDPQGKNYGIGILLGGNGKPLSTSPTLLEYVQRELQESGNGSYLNSDAVKQELTEAVLRWQGVPESLWSRFELLLPSDAGTGAVQMAVQVAALLQDGLSTLAVEELGWPAYRAVAVSARLRFQTFPTDAFATGDGVLPLYQAGPLNTTGQVPSAAVVRARAQAAAVSGAFVVLDRAYSGFEYARRVARMPYAALMTESFRAQVLPFADAGVPFALAISPTKAFVTFALRPCGLLLVFLPDPSRRAEVGQKLTALVRARGCSFEHPITRAFVKALIRDRGRLEAEHAAALRRCADAEDQWRTLAEGTPIAELFSARYAGLFRNPTAKPDAARELYDAHLYPVFTEGRCRLNITGLPSDAAQARQAVAAFARCCG
jgi:aspartate/tyrosine/aromatic aminotransferase